ncbi:unnamed protein product, partial [Owenia fusiformis]
MCQDVFPNKCLESRIGVTTCHKCHFLDTNIFYKHHPKKKVERLQQYVTTSGGDITLNRLLCFPKATIILKNILEVQLTRGRFLPPPPLLYKTAEQLELWP